MSPTIVSDFMEIEIFRYYYTRNRLGEVYGGARVWQESCAWGRDKLSLRLISAFYGLCAVYCGSYPVFSLTQSSPQTQPGLPKYARL